MARRVSGGDGPLMKVQSRNQEDHATAANLIQRPVVVCVRCGMRTFLPLHSFSLSPSSPLRLFIFACLTFLPLPCPSRPSLLPSDVDGGSCCVFFHATTNIFILLFLWSPSPFEIPPVPSSPLPHIPCL